ncbi:imm11 family protein [Vitiosangium sp. GDMCC 1.1324]|uniref:imm11 family protein n=1 Tax=Vitiosangium sp. (strain GDMCC 1.1324) TaxID=2138576 RepID=UPI0035188F6F
MPRFPLDVSGHELDFCWAAFAIPVVHGRFVRLFERLGVQDVQFIPVQVEGHAGSFFILNTLRTIRCIDDARCEEALYWQPEDGQPEKVGRYRSVAGMRIDPSKVGDARIFRTWGWSLGLIISEDLKQAMEAEGLTGARFVEV